MRSLTDTEYEEIFEAAISRVMNAPLEEECEKEGKSVEYTTVYKIRHDVVYGTSFLHRNAGLKWQENALLYTHDIFHDVRVIQGDIALPEPQ